MNIKIYGHNECTYCVSATTLLDALGKPYEYHNVKLSEEAYDEMKKYAGQDHKTVPVIVVDEKFIGGYNELTRLI